MIPNRQSDWASVADMLNAKDEARSRRRKPHRLQPEWYSAAESVWSVTLCARHHHEPFRNEAIAGGVIDALRFYRDRGDCRIYAYCLMSDHLHAVVQIRAPQNGGGSALPALVGLLGRFKRYTTTQVAWKHGLEGRLWQREFFDHFVRNSEDFESQYRYALDNPVRKGICSILEDYPWSGIMDEWAS